MRSEQEVDRIGMACLAYHSWERYALQILTTRIRSQQAYQKVVPPCKEELSGLGGFVLRLAKKWVGRGPSPPRSLLTRHTKQLTNMAIIFSAEYPLAPITSIPKFSE